MGLRGNKVTAFVPVYNEEKRIKYALSCLKWCDSIYVLDKSSTDRTVEIAREMGAYVNIIPHEDCYDPHELDYMLSIESDWIVLFTASDLLDFDLAIKVKNALQNDEVDVIYVPFKQYVLGINEKKSPWYGGKRRLAFRKEVIKIDYNSVHGALCLNSKKELFIQEGGYMYHLTHATVDGMMDRHIRYWKGEAAGFSDKNMKKPLKSVVGAVVRLLFKGAFWGSSDTIALSFAYLSYSMMSYVYKWEHLHGDALNKYNGIREEISNLWRKQI